MPILLPLSEGLRFAGLVTVAVVINVAGALQRDLIGRLRRTLLRCRFWGSRFGGFGYLASV